LSRTAITGIDKNVIAKDAKSSCVFFPPSRILAKPESRGYSIHCFKSAFALAGLPAC